MGTPLPARGARALRWDGAIGTELIALGLDLARDPPESFTLAHPEVLRALHARYVAAGADVIQTNTFGANRPRLESTRLAGALAELNRAAVRLAREAGAPHVVASLGPTGLDPLAPEAAARMEAAYGEQIEHLTAAGADALHFETMCHPIEAAAGLRAARRFAPRLPVISSFTVVVAGGDYWTPLGVPLTGMAAAVLDLVPDAIGINCSLEARRMLGPLRALRALTDLPILVQPQAGAPSTSGENEGLHMDDPSRFARDARALVRAGADAIGGCCGAGPAHIAALRDALREGGSDRG